MTDSASLSRRRFLTTAASAAGITLLPGNLLAHMQDPVVNATQKNGKLAVREKVSWKALPFPLKQVRLGGGVRF